MSCCVKHFQDYGPCALSRAVSSNVLLCVRLNFSDALAQALLSCVVVFSLVFSFPFSVLFLFRAVCAAGIACS